MFQQNLARQISRMLATWILAIVCLLLMTIGNPALASGEEAAIAATTDRWLRTVTSGQPEAATEVMQLYAKDAILLGTTSAQIRDTPAEIKDYFDFFTQLPNLAVADVRSHIRVYGDTAINSGYYSFSYDKAGQTKMLPARFTFVYQRVNGEWLIEDHHSSAIPQPPAQLKAAID
jgi:uncharacterized protein (TIGR02246 family)